MPAIVRTEFSLALNQVATERGIDPNVVLDSIKAAILAAYRKDYGGDILEELIVELDPNTGSAKIFKDKKDITPPGFGRIAAQTAKQVILQRIREAEKQAILTDYSAKVGNVVSGMILRFDGPNVIVDIGRGQGVMPPNEQIPQERYHLNERFAFYIEGIHETYRGNEIVVSRAHKGLVAGLFKREVPEVAQGAVEVRDIVREAGARTKMAVFSSQAGVDPVGSCVGQKGVRVQAVIGELGNEEKIDIIQWSNDPVQYITACLAPAKDLQINLNEKNKTAQVLVPEDQLSLAIGRDGQNVRLAAKLTTWKIDLKGKEIVKDRKTDKAVRQEVSKIKDDKTVSKKVEKAAKEELKVSKVSKGGTEVEKVDEVEKKATNTVKKEVKEAVKTEEKETEKEIAVKEKTKAQVKVDTKAEKIIPGTQSSDTKKT